MLKPLFKNPGGKRRVASKIVDKIREIEFSGYHEPMFGAGAVFCALANEGLLSKKRLTIADIQSAIISLLTIIKYQPTQITADVNRILKEYYKNPSDVYYKYRERWNTGLKDPAIFLFLKQTSFNGLWRENKNGEMNAPWGKYKSPSVPDLLQIQVWCLWLQKAVLRCQDFDKLGKRIRPGDLVYFDPPYYGAFNSFSAKGFNEEDHERLINFCANLSNKGAHVVYSNVNSPEVIDLVKHWRKAARGVSFSVSSFQDGRYISGYTKAREPKEELLVIAKAN